ncbi:MAG: YcxB family protein [Lachnospiraceae bacterium]|nr:YcxB family protein [Lachnospiraceae bacterium]
MDEEKILTEEKNEAAADAASEAVKLTPEEEAAAANEALCDEMLENERYCFTYMLRFKDLVRHKLRFSLLDPIQGPPFWLCIILAFAYLIVSWKELGAQNRAVVIVLIVLLLWYVPVRAILNAARNAVYLRDHCSLTEYHICDDGMVLCQDGQRQAVSYGNIQRIREYRSWTYAQVFRNSGFIFPKDVIGEKYEELRAFLKSKVSGK